MKKWEPHDYQLEGIKFLLGNANGGLLWSPGCGKTAVVYAALSILKQRGMLKRALVVAPKRIATSVWPAERAKWLDFWPLTLDVLHGPKKDAILAGITADIVTVTPDGLDWLSRNGRIQALDPDVLIVDESSYFRHPSSQRFKNLRAMLGRFRRRVILTGTPMPRGYEDLWPQIYILDEGGALGRYITHYRMKYFQDVGYGFPDWQLLPGADKAINEKIRSLVLREDALDHIDLPALVHNQITVQLPEPSRKTYAAMEKQFYLAMGNAEVIAPNAAVMGSKLRQICNGFVYTSTGGHNAVRLHDEKLDALVSLINDLAGHPAMLFYEFDADRDLIMHKFPDAVLMAGSTLQVNTAITRFNRGEISLLVAHPKSAGHGLNLADVAGAVIFYGPTWDCELHEQAIARVWRQGNPNDRVFVHTIVAQDTIEEKVASVLSQKVKTQEQLLLALKRQPRQPLPVVQDA